MADSLAVLSEAPARARLHLGAATGGPIGSETAARDVDDPWPGRTPPTSEPGGLQGLPDRVVAACVALDMCTDRDDHLVLLGEVLLQSLTLVEHGVRALCA